MDEISLLKKKLEAVEELSGDGYWEWDLDTSDLHISNRLLELLGYEAQDVSGNMQEWLHSKIDPSDLAHAIDVSQKYINGEILNYRQFLKYQHKSGNWLDIMCRGKLIYSDKKPVKMIGINTDITDFKRLEQQVEVERDKAVASSKSSKIFLANMSHEIRTPMNSVVALSDLMLRDKNLSDKHREFVNCIVNSANILLKLLGDILEYSKLESLELSLNNKKCDMKTKKSLIFNTWHEKMREKGIDFKVHLSKKVPRKIVMDKQRFLQVTNILLSNAHKYTETGKITIKLYMEDVMLAVRVKDTGVGVPKDSLERILNPFERANTRKEGTGIGLSIAKTIVEKLGGRLWFKSDVGKGSSFYFTYPVNENVEEYSSERGGESDSFELENVDVLVVEDNRANQFVMGEILKRFSKVRYDIADCGEDAIVCVSNKSYDIIFMDVVMPGMGGIEATNEVRKIDNSVYIVAATANSISGDREKYTKIMDDYISKPLTFKDVKKVFYRYTLFRDKSKDDDN